MTEQVGGYDRIVTEAPLDISALRGWMNTAIYYLEMKHLTQCAGEGKRLYSQLVKPSLPVAQPTPGPMAWQSVRELVNAAGELVAKVAGIVPATAFDVRSKIAAVKGQQAPEPEPTRKCFFPGCDAHPTAAELEAARLELEAYDQQCLKSFANPSETKLFSILARIDSARAKLKEGKP